MPAAPRTPPALMTGCSSVPEEEAFAACPADTIDYAVMERISGNGHGGSSGKRGALVAPIEAGWSDVGSWAAIMDVNEKDEDGNVARGDVYTHEMRNSMIFGHHRLVAAVGLEDVIVVETADAVLAADRRRVEDVRDAGRAFEGRRTGGAGAPSPRPQALGLVRDD